MKSKMHLLAAALVLLVAVISGIHATHDAPELAAEHPLATRSQWRTQRDGVTHSVARVRPADDPGAPMMTVNAFRALRDSVLLIGDHGERLAAIRGRLGMNISEKVYQMVLADYGYQVDPERLCQLLIKQWQKEDPQAVVEWAQHFFNGIPGYRTYYLGEWLRMDPEAAEAWAKTHMSAEDLAAARRVYGEYLENPSVREPTAAELVQRVRSALATMGGDGPELDPQESSKRHFAMINDILMLGQSDPSLAMDLLLIYKEGSESTAYAIKRLFKSWATHDPDAALARARGLENPEQRFNALLEVLPSWQLLHSDQTIDQALPLDDLPEEKYQDLMGRLVENWAAEQPIKAMEYAMGLDNEDLRNSLMYGVVVQWVKRAPYEVMTWMDGLQSGEFKDFCLSQVSSRMAIEDFSHGRQIIARIEDETMRKYAARQIMLAQGDDAIRTHPLEVLDLARQFPDVAIWQARSWAEDIPTAQIPALRAWLESIRALHTVEADDSGSTEEFSFRDGKPVFTDQQYLDVMKILDGRKG